MLLTDAGAIRNALARHRNFEECLLTDVRWVDFGMTIDLCVNYIWDGSGVRARISEDPHPIVLRARKVQELNVRNSITSAIAREPDRVNWGISEFAQIVLLGDSPAARRYSDVGDGVYHHLVVEWEGARRIDVVMASLEIL